MKRVTCKSGLEGWQAKLHEVYASFGEFEGYCMTYAIHTRLGFGSVRGCWRANPIVQGSISPSDLQRVKSIPIRWSPGRKRSVRITEQYGNH